MAPMHGTVRVRFVLSLGCRRVRRAIVTLSASLVVWFASSDASGDTITQWNQVMHQAVRADTTMPGPTFSSRNYAMLHAAMFDAVNAIAKRYSAFSYTTPGPDDASIDAAAAQAAHRVLSGLYPSQTALFDAALATSLSAIPDSAAKQAGVQVGNSAGQHMLDLRSNDGAFDPSPYMPTMAPGHWQPDPLHPTQQALGPNWGQVDYFSIDPALRPILLPPPPPALGTPEYQAAFDEVRSLGELNSSTRTAEQTEIGIFWGYDRGGFGPPPILYNKIAETVAKLAGNTTVENARMFALVNLAMADAGILAWDAKYLYDLWRPITAIREIDPTWTPLGAPAEDPADNFTPPFPAYPSGHATFGAALFEMLANFFGTDQFGFTIGSEELPGIFRSFQSFSEAAEENGRSRIYLGIHWEYDNQEGQKLGRAVADEIFANALAPVPEPSTFALLGLGLAAVVWARRRNASRSV